MIKWVCNKCGEDFTGKDFFCEIIVRNVRPVMLPPHKGQPQILEQLEEARYHLCLKCWNNLVSNFKKLS